MGSNLLRSGEYGGWNKIRGDPKKLDSVLILFPIYSRIIFCPYDLASIYYERVQLYGFEEIGRKVTVMSAADVARGEADLKTISSSSLMGIRLKTILCAYKQGIHKVCEAMDLSRDTVYRWMKNYKSLGLDGLLNARKPSRSKLTDTQKTTLKEWIDTKPTLTLKELVHECEREFDLKIGKSSLHRFLQSLEYSHITGRKIHHKANTQEQARFKKKTKSPNGLKSINSCSSLMNLGLEPTLR